MSGTPQPLSLIHTLQVNSAIDTLQDLPISLLIRLHLLHFHTRHYLEMLAGIAQLV